MPVVFRRHGYFVHFSTPEKRSKIVGSRAGLLPLLLPASAGDERVALKEDGISPHLLRVEKIQEAREAAGMYHPTGRVLTVLELLQSRPGLTGPELAARLETDVRTVRRYITKLQDVGNRDALRSLAEEAGRIAAIP